MNNIKIILVYPPQRVYEGYGQDKQWIPLGIASIAANIADLTNNIACLDLFHNKEDEAFDIIKSHLDKEAINLVGFTMMTEQRHAVIRLCESLKSVYDLRNYEIKTVVGGPHPSIMYDQLQEHYKNVLDYIVIGEGENVFRDLVTFYMDDENIKVLGRVIKGENSDINALKPAFSGLKYFVPEIKAMDQAAITFSRGCTNHCTFCSTNKVWSGYRSRSAMNVLREIQDYINYYAVKYFKFHDDAATADLDNLKRLCAMIKHQGMNIEFEITARADQFDKDLIRLLYEAGCVKVAIGLETGNDKLRRFMGKKYDMEAVKKNVKLLRDRGMQVHGLLIVGYPGETDETIEDTCIMLRDLKLNSWSKLPGLMVVPGTPVYNKLKQQGWINDEYWLANKPCPYYTGEYDMNKLIAWGNRINNACNYKKVLIAGVINEDEKVFDEYLRLLKLQKVDGNVTVDYKFILHNCNDMSKYLDIGQYETINNNLAHDKSHTWSIEKFDFIANQKNKLVDYACNNNYTHIFWVDSDIMLEDPRLLQHLLDTNLNIVSEIFWTKWPGSENEGPNCWDSDQYTFYGSVDRFKKSGLYQVGGTGACILVDTKIYLSGANYTRLNSVSFSMWEDRAFCIRAEALGFFSAIDTTMPVRHLYTKELVNQYFKEAETRGDLASKESSNKNDEEKT